MRYVPDWSARAQGSFVLLGVVRALAFWGAILLPITYLPLLFGDLDGWQFPLFVSLLGTNVVCLALGQGYTPGRQ